MSDGVSNQAGRRVAVRWVSGTREKEIQMVMTVAKVAKRRSENFVKFRSDERLRRELDERQCEWEPVREVSISDVDISDNEYQTRLDVATADREVIDKYKERLQAGDVFPEVLLAADRRYRKGGKPTFKIICGKHRLIAMIELGITSVNALVMWIGEDSDKAKARDISIHDNVANGKPVSHEVMNEQVARECIAENLGFANGMPDSRITRAVCERHKIKKPDSVKKHIERLLFQHECRARKLDPPAAIEVCAAAYSFVDREGFGEIAKAVCKFGDTKGLTSVLRQCRRARKSGDDVVRAVTDHVAGYTSSPGVTSSMSSVDRIRRLCDRLIKHLESDLANDASITSSDCDLVDDYIANVCERGSTVVSVLRKKATGA
jgi:hypothetical protein